MYTDHVLQGAGGEEELLHETEAFAFDLFVGRVENLADGFPFDLVVHSTDVVAGVEDAQIEGVDCLGLPEAKTTDRSSLVTGNRRVVGNSFDHLSGNPAVAQSAVVIGVGFSAA